LAAAYDATGAAWDRGPALVYDRLAEVVVAAAPVAVAGRTVLDIGAGTGAGSRAIAAAGGRPVAVDFAFGMLAAGQKERPPAAQADARALPFADDALGGAVAAFSLNHVPDAAAGLREAARVVGAGGPLVASSYAGDDGHPVKAAVETALAETGWQPPPWAGPLRETAVAGLATVDRCAAAAAAAGLAAEVLALQVPFPELTPGQLVEWRLGMAQHAPYVATLAPAARAAVCARAVELLGRPPPLVRSILVITAAATTANP
jgi:SAM-dependent methyltransferase